MHPNVAGEEVRSHTGRHHLAVPHVDLHDEVAREGERLVGLVQAAQLVVGALTQAALVVGGASLRRGSSETLDLASAASQGIAWRLAGASPPTGCSSAAVAVAPCFSVKPAGKRLVRPVVLVIGGQCGSRLTKAVHAFDASAAEARLAWKTARIPQLPQASSGSGAGLVLPRGWSW